MSLISDALKRQEQLRAPGAGAAQHEVAVAAPPEVAVAAPPEVAAAAPPDTSPRQRPNLAAPAAQPRAALPRPASPPSGGPTSPPQGAQPRRVSGVPATNPFLERERAAARRPNHTVLLMPILGLIMLWVLLFFRREFVPQESTETATPYSPRKVEEPAPARDEGTGNGEEGTGNGERGTGSPSADGRDEVRPTQDLDKTVEVSDGAHLKNQREADEPSALRQSPDFAAAGGATTAAQAAPTSPPSAAQPSNQSTDKPTNRQTDKPATSLAEAQPQPTTWPAFTLTGIAVGRERLAILNTGEMLLAGETAKCGVKVEKVNASTVVFAWGGETKTLRKGEQSDKPAD